MYLLAGLWTGAGEAVAQAAGVLEEIIVTARRREESLTAVPVAINSISGATLQDLGISSVDGLATLVPSLLIGEGSGTHQGGVIALRGIGGASSNPLGDQAVAFNIDGVQVARATVRRMGMMDTTRVDVLRGPQALFFGKNSPGGIIAVRTADPTEQLSGRISGGFESYAEEWRTEGHVAGPITDTLGFRLAGYHSTMNGWIDDEVPANNPLQPRDDEQPDSDEYAIRGTLLFEPNERFTARAKLTYNDLEGPGNTYNAQFIDCPRGSPQNGAIDDCKANDKTSVADPGPGWDFANRGFASGKTFLNQDQTLASLELNYDFNDHLALTSVTGYYDMGYKSSGNYTNSYIPANILVSFTYLDIEEWSQEFRLTSDFDGRFNFTAGAHYHDSNTELDVTSMVGAPGSLAFGAFPGPLELNQYIVEQEGEAWSAFGQVLFDVTPTVELAMGVRYSDEEKKLPKLLVDLTPTFAGGGAVKRVTPPVAQNTLVNERSFDNWSPEFTLTWRPTDDLTLYGAYKQGFLSGGFNGGTGVTTTSADASYDEEVVDGFEAGIKATLLNGTLRTSLTTYRYEVQGLQVIVVVNNVVQALRNAAEVTTQGAEFDFTWLTPIEGLTVHGDLAYLDGEYDDYQANCYLGQNASSPVPCVPQLNRVTGQVGLFQDLSGSELIWAPEWTGGLGFTFERPITSGLKLGLTADLTFSEDYLTSASSAEHGRSPDYTLWNASIRLSDIDDRWEVALIGVNLTDEYYWRESNDIPFTGTAVGVTPGALADTAASLNRGRQVMLRLSYAFGAE